MLRAQTREAFLLSLLTQLDVVIESGLRRALLSRSLDGARKVTVLVWRFEIARRSFRRAHDDDTTRAMRRRPSGGGRRGQPPTARGG